MLVIVKIAVEKESTRIGDDESSATQLGELCVSGLRILIVCDEAAEDTNDNTLQKSGDFGFDIVMFRKNSNVGRYNSHDEHWEKLETYPRKEPYLHLEVEGRERDNVMINTWTLLA